ncbi:phospho-2-dehydro-3-deoxyheptonate aldolase, partial [Thraustotheca clavata]
NSMSWRDDKSFNGIEKEGNENVRNKGLKFTKNVPRFLQAYRTDVELDHESSLALKRPTKPQDEKENDNDEDELDEVQKEAILAYEAAQKEALAKETEGEYKKQDESVKAKRKAPLSFSTGKIDDVHQAKPPKKKRKAVKDLVIAQALTDQKKKATWQKLYYLIQFLFCIMATQSFEDIARQRRFWALETNEQQTLSPEVPPQWTPSSWRKFPIKQQPPYPDAKAFDKVLNKLQSLPPLVSVQEIERLRDQLAEVADGKRFLLQGGDCAESFRDCRPDLIEKKLRIMMQMSLVLVWGARMPTTRVARMAGQFAKPRSQETEVIDGVEVCTFRGENVNGFDKNDRTPDPQRLLEGYYHSAATMNYGRLLLDSGFADIHDAGKWDLGFVQNSIRSEQYSHMVSAIQDSLHFVHTCGVGYDTNLKTMDLFISHEGLGLGYEEAMTRKVNGKYYNVGTDFLWIGDRTRQLDHAHVEYFRGIANPIGVKVGPSMKPDELVELIQKLWPNPSATPGKITLITRYGESKVAAMLPAHIEAVQKAGLKVVWSCDPYHGNTITTDNGYKTRPFSRIFSELRQTLDIHVAHGSYLGGVHFEMTGENVTECIGGPEQLDETDLTERYTTACDPRMNYAQICTTSNLINMNY